ncbi:MAG: MFS transporter [Actinomycetota bacterium]|nr:MAG: MFS transporter [Actinomycetota bacterium]
MTRADTPWTTPRLLLFVGGLTLGPLTYAVLTTSVIPLVPKLSAHYGVSQASASLIVIVALVAGTVATPLLGRLGDLYGKRRMLLVVLSLLFSGCLLAAVTDSFALLLVARLLQGPGCAAVPLGFAVIADTVPGARLNFSLGLLSASTSIGAGLGFFFGGAVGALTDSTQVMFGILAAVAALALLVTRRIVASAPPAGTGRIDLVGSGLLVVGLTGCLVALSEGGSWGWSSGTTLLVAGIGLGSLGAWAIHGWFARNPLVDTKVFFSRSICVGSVPMLALGLGQYTVLLVVVVIGQTDPAVAGYGLGLSTFAASTLLLPCIVVQAATSTSMTLLARRIGLLATLVLGALIATGGFVLLSVWNNVALALAIGASVVSLGFGLLVSASPAYVVRTVALSERGVAAGMNFICRTAGQALGTATVAAAVTMATPAGTAIPGLGGYAVALRIAAGASLTAAVVLLSLRPAARRRAGESQPGPATSATVAGTPASSETTAGTPASRGQELNTRA